MNRKFIMMGAGLMALGVMLGAFGAHALKERLEPSMLQIYHTGVEYQFYHAIGVLIVGVLFRTYPSVGLKWAGWLFIAGIVLFSGSLYLLALTGINELGMITPIGGVSFIAGWMTMALSLVKRNQA
jgi:uncharacterized membrane protein YgdD (TMEM256/DUF423 family)